MLKYLVEPDQDVAIGAEYVEIDTNAKKPEKSEKTEEKSKTEEK